VEIFKDTMGAHVYKVQWNEFCSCVAVRNVNGYCTSKTKLQKVRMHFVHVAVINLDDIYCPNELCL